MSLYETSRHYNNIPISTLRDPRIILEDFTVYRYFRKFVSKRGNTNMMYYLELLIKINLFKLDASVEKANEIYQSFLAGREIIPELVTRSTTNNFVDIKTSIDLKNNLFSEIETYIYHHFDSFVYPEFTMSPEYQELLLETE